MANVKFKGCIAGWTVFLLGLYFAHSSSVHYKNCGESNFSPYRSNVIPTLHKIYVEGVSLFPKTLLRTVWCAIH
jgi:hypothetical protein